MNEKWLNHFYMNLRVMYELGEKSHIIDSMSIIARYRMNEGLRGTFRFPTPPNFYPDSVFRFVYWTISSKYSIPTSCSLESLRPLLKAGRNWTRGKDRLSTTALFHWNVCRSCCRLLSKYQAPSLCDNFSHRSIKL